MQFYTIGAVKGDHDTACVWLSLFFYLTVAVLLNLSPVKHSKTADTDALNKTLKIRPT